jgi:hypothetical protein
MQISSKEGLKASLRRAVDRARTALLRGLKDGLAGTQLAASAVEGAVQAVESAREVFFEISREDEDEFRLLVAQIHGLVGLLLAQIEQRREPAELSLWPAAHSGSRAVN